VVIQFVEKTGEVLVTISVNVIQHNPDEIVRLTYYLLYISGQLNICVCSIIHVVESKFIHKKTRTMFYWSQCFNKSCI